MNSKNIYKISAFFGVVILLSSCFKDENSYGYEYMPDMYRSPAIEAYVDYGEVRTWKSNTELTNTPSAKVPPLGTIPFKGAGADANYDFPYKRLPSKGMIESHGLTSLEYNDGDYDASVADVNPMPFTKSNVATGKVLYDRFCDHCHGEKGVGDGKVANNELINPPADAFKKPDGQLFYSITYGKGVMGAHGTQLNQKERWEVISYIRTLNGEEAMEDPVETVENEIVEAGNFSSASLMSDLTKLAQETANDQAHASEHVLNLDHLVFASSSANLDMTESKETLDALVSFMKGGTNSLEFDGHTDNTGSEEGNKVLSLARANAVKTYLVNNGIDASRIEAKGYGSDHPKASNDNEEGRDANRRTEVKIK